MVGAVVVLGSSGVDEQLLREFISPLMRSILDVKNEFKSATKAMTIGLAECIESSIVKLSSNCDFMVFHVMRSVSQLSALSFRSFRNNSDPRINLIKVSFIIASWSDTLSNFASIEFKLDNVSDTQDRK